MGVIPPLPADGLVPDLLTALEQHSCAIVVAEPGAGKTTRLPPALLAAPWARGRKILMLEPRRIAARAAATRIATERGETVGNIIGYQVRMERRIGPGTRLEVITGGILTRRLQDDPLADDLAAIIFDEFHERSLDTDLALALALDIQRTVRPDLRLLVMSATLDAERLSQHLGDAPVIHSTGRTFPVETRYGDKPAMRDLGFAMARTLLKGLDAGHTGLLAFLPGEGEIRQTERALLDLGLPQDCSVHPLYGALSLEGQALAIAPPDVGRRKIVLATNIAETSLTIEGISGVVDSGLARKARFDPQSGMTSLALERISQASADQRRGRAGRLGPGMCWRLWPEPETRAMARHERPEILDADLCPLALELAAWGVDDPARLPFLDPPPQAAFAQGRALLRALDALDESGAISATGRLMVAMPLHPRLARMVLHGEALGAGSLAADIAALVSERDVLDRTSRQADLAIRLDLLKSGGGRNGHAGLHRVREIARQIGRQGDKRPGATPAVSPGVLVALAWPDRLAQARGAPGRFRFAGGGGGMLPLHDPLAQEPFLAVALTNGAAGDQQIYLASPISRAEIDAQFSEQCVDVPCVSFDARSGILTARMERRFGAIVLEERPLIPEPHQLQAAMARGLASLGSAAWPWTAGARNLQARVAFLNVQFPELDWPDLSDARLERDAEALFAPFLAGVRRRAEFDRLDLHMILMAQIPPALQSTLNRLAPKQITIPSGADISIDYGADGAPTLRARLQEMFGLATTPALAEGRVKLRIELLSPAGKPLAVTQSLESFWTNVYPDVRSDMRGRYPKHAWPDNPLETAPAKPRRR